MGVQKDKCTPPSKKWLVLLVPTLSFSRNRWEEFRSDFLPCSGLKAFENQFPVVAGLCKKPTPLVASSSHESKSSLFSSLPLSGQREPWAPCTESRMITFCVYYIMRCHIPHNSPCITYSGINPEEFCLVHCIYSHETKIRIHQPRTACKSKRVFIHQYECPVH